MDMEYMFGLTVCLITYHRLGDKYEGEWYQSYKHGEGVDTFDNGDRYTGEYSFGKFSGKGMFAWHNGMSYEGDFEAGMRHGQGIWKQNIDGGDTYTGGYVDDK